jgi:twitching motility protein PilJ
MRTNAFFALVLSATIAAIPGVCVAADSAVATIARVQVMSLQLSRYADDAANGNQDAFKALAHTRADMTQRLTKLEPSRELAAAWKELDSDVGAILDNQEAIIAATALAEDFNAKIPVLNSRMDEAVKILTESSAGTKAQVMIASRQMLLTSRMQRRVQAIVAGREESQAAADGLQRDAQFYGLVLTALIDGNADLNIKAMTNPNAREVLKEIKQQWQDLTPEVTKLLNAVPALQTVRSSAEKADSDALTLLLRADALMR